MVILGICFGTFLKKWLQLFCLQVSGNLQEEIDRLHSCVVNVVNNDASSFRKISERSAIPGALISSKCFSTLNTLFDRIFQQIAAFPSN